MAGSLSPKDFVRPGNSKGVARGTGLTTASGPLQAFEERLVEELATAWQRGEGPRVEELLTRHPELYDHAEIAIRLIYEEICLRQDCGQEVPAQEVFDRFPQWEAQLEVLLACHSCMGPSPVAPVFPEVGEVLGEFRLLALLGRGALGRVFLAKQPSLADRPVVLKVTPCDGEEHLSLARLQHTHIVPLYAVQEFPERNLRVMCMPYLGGTALSQLLEGLRPWPLGQRTGQDLLRLVDQIQATIPLAFPSAGPARQFFARASYVEAVCWMGVCLAEALHYAHERGLVHLDLKPSNVLVAADGQPLLLDFHLAREPLRAGAPAPEWFGGTSGYMSPEQKAAMSATYECQPIPLAVDGRSDVYSLGLLLYEALVGKVPPGAPLPTLRQRQPHVSVGLGDILCKCLAHDPNDRYPSAAALAADLRRHLSDLPLRGAANRSWTESWRKWRRRRPHALAWSGMALAVLVTALAAGTVVLTQVRQRLGQAEMALADGRHYMQNRDYPQAIYRLMQGSALARGIPGGGKLTQELDGQWRLAKRAEAVQALHTAANRIRFLFDPESLSFPEIQSLDACCRAVWDARNLITDRSHGELDPEVEQGLQTDLLELAILWADVQVRLLPERTNGVARREALRRLEEAETLFGPSLALSRERQLHAEALGLPDLAGAAAHAAAAQAPQTPWEHYALGRSLLRSGKFELAAPPLEQAIALQPQNFWPHFSLGKCAYRLRHYEDAITAFTACITLAPQSAPCYFNRALAHAALSQTDRALHDYSRALQYDPALAVAALNRGVLHYRAQRYGEALADLQRALKGGADPATVHYNLALVHLAQQDRAAALACVRRALQDNRQHKDARELHERLQQER
jgi:serine/threonine protein kinase/Flp pilus assembly protein TadD